MIDHLGVPPWGAIALVSYVPDPLRSFLTDMSRLLPGNDDPQPHITILPPRPLREPVQTASISIRATLQRFAVFPVELSKVRHFPESNFLYLDIGYGNKSIRELHAALNSGELEHSERFEFLPHLTLGGPFEAAEVEKAKGKAEALWESRDIPAQISIDSLVCLWLPPSSDCRDWRRLWSCSLGNASEPPRQQIAETAFTTQTY